MIWTPIVLGIIALGIVIHCYWRASDVWKREP